jgi:hypothetical protein
MRGKSIECGNTSEHIPDVKWALFQSQQMLISRQRTNGHTQSPVLVALSSTHKSLGHCGTLLIIGRYEQGSGYDNAAQSAGLQGIGLRDHSQAVGVVLQAV